MIAFGVAPGIKSLAYCAIEWDGNGHWSVLDQAVLSKSRLLKGNPSLGMLQKRFHCHRLIYTTVWERYLPTLLAIGPQADPGEPAVNAEIAATILAEFGRLWGAKVVRVDRDELALGFDTSNRRTLRRVLRDYVSMLPNDQRGILAMAAAVYGATNGVPILRSAE